MRGNEMKQWMLQFFAVILAALALAWWLWKKGDKWSPPWQEKNPNGAEKVTALLEVIDRQLAHERSPYQTESQTDYGRGYIKGLEWTKTEICKAFGI